MKITFGDNPIIPDKIKTETTGFKELAARFKSPIVIANKDARRQYFVRGQIKGNANKDKRKNQTNPPKHWRKDINLQSVSLLVIDADKDATSPKSAHKALKKLGYNHFVYTSYSHTRKQNRWRMVIPCKIDYGNPDKNKASLESTYLDLLKILKKHGCSCEPNSESQTLSQAWFLSYAKNKDVFEFYQWHKGKNLKSLSPGSVVESVEAGQNKNGTQEDMWSDFRNNKKARSIIRTWVYGDIKDGVAPDTVRQRYWNIGDLNPSIKEQKESNPDEVENQLDGLIHGAIKKRDKAKDNYETDEWILPAYPFGLIDSWPEPFPELFNEWRSLAGDHYNEVLLTPSFFAFHALLLKGKWRNHRGRRPNLLNFVLSPTAGGKDSNSVDVIEAIKYNVKGKNELSKTLTSYGYHFINVHGTTADRTILERIQRTEGNYLWTNTEAVLLMKRLAQAELRQPDQWAMTGTFNSIYDGKSIPGKELAGNYIDGHPGPNAHHTFYAQNEPFYQSVTRGMLDNGFFGRNDIYIDTAEPTFEFDEGKPPDKIDKSIKELYRGSIKKIQEANDNQLVLLTDEAKECFREWLEDNRNTKAITSDHFAVLKRCDQTFEKIITIVHAWSNLVSKKPENKFGLKSLELLLPLLEYQIDSRLYALAKSLEGEAAEMERKIYEAYQSLAKETVDDWVKLSDVWDKKLRPTNQDNKKLYDDRKDAMIRGNQFKHKTVKRTVFIKR